MPTATADQLEQRLRDYRLGAPFDGDISASWVLPNYRGHSLANIPATVAALFGVEQGEMAPPLDPIYWQGFGDIRHVVVTLVDALGYLQLNQMLAEHPNCIWAQLASQGIYQPLTSICPSTTATALSTVMSGAEPISHGLLGYELWLREYGVLTQMLAITPALSPKAETLIDWGLEPESFLPVKTLAERLEPQGIAAHTLVNRQYTRGGLTRMAYPGFRVEGHKSVNDMWRRAYRQLKRAGDAPSYHFIYWGALDTAIHRHGTADGKWQEQFQVVTEAAERHFFRRLGQQERQNTLFVLIADHGFIDSPVGDAFDTDHSAFLQDEMLVPHSGEARCSFLHCRQGDEPSVQQALQDELGERWSVVRTDEAIRAGLFGHGQTAPESTARLGHFIALSRDLSYLDRGQKRHVLRGRHGGLTAEEMLIPWLAARLDG